MRSNTSNLILALCSVLILTIVAFGYVLYRNASEFTRIPPITDQRRPQARSVESMAASRSLSRQLRRDIEQQRRRINELQLLLHKRDEVLRQQAAQLESQTAESKQLQAEADRYLELLNAVVSESAESIQENLTALDDFDELATLSSELGESSPIEPPNLSTLEAALETAEWELEQSSAAVTTAESNATAAGSQLTELQDSILDSGEMAVPLLVQLLSDAEPELRQWAAQSLSEIGENSTLVVDALLVAAGDDDQDVREAAQLSIDQLSRN